MPIENKPTVALVDLSFSSDKKIIDSSDLIQNDKQNLLGFSIIKRLTALGIKCIVYSMHGFCDYVRKAFSEEVGAKGYILKDSNNANISLAIKIVAAGGTFIQEELEEALLQSQSLENSVPFTGKEKAIAELVAKNLSNTQIAKELNISKRTVENHITHIYDKIGCKNRLECIEFLKKIF